jgi:hypothetical protein
MKAVWAFGRFARHHNFRNVESKRDLRNCPNYDQ